MHFARRAQPSAIIETDHRSNPPRIASRTHQPNPQAGFGAYVMEEARLVAILGDDQIHAPVVVIITQRGTPLLAIDLDSALLARHRLQTPVTVAPQPQAPARIATRGLGLGGKKVLAEEYVFEPIAIEIANARGEGRSKLSFTRKGNSDKTIAAVQEPIESSVVASRLCAAFRASPSTSGIVAWL